MNPGLTAMTSTYFTIEFSSCLGQQSWVYFLNRRGLSKEVQCWQLWGFWQFCQFRTYTHPFNAKALSWMLWSSQVTVKIWAQQALTWFCLGSNQRLARSRFDADAYSLFAVIVLFVVIFGPFVWLEYAIGRDCWGGPVHGLSTVLRFFTAKIYLKTVSNLCLSA